jgi:hypothetical protein
MVTVLQDPISRRWGFRVSEGLGGVDKQEASRVLYEDYNYTSPGEVFQVVTEIQKSFKMKRFRTHKRDGVWTYEVGAPNSNDVLLSESGWPLTQMEDMTKQMDSLSEHIQGTPKMYVPPKPINMAFGGESEVDISKIDTSWVGKVDDE